MSLIAILILLALLVGAAGFAWHALWWLLIVVAILLTVNLLNGRRW